MSFPAIPFAKPSIGPGEEEAVLRVLRSGWLTTGKEALAFEEEFAAFVGTPWGLAVNSATSGLHLALEALGIGPGDYVALCPYTFTASAEVIRYLGAHPLFVDAAPGTFHLCPDALEAVLVRGQQGRGPLPKAIMPVHIGGVSWDLDRIYELGSTYGIPFVEDAAHCFPARLGPNAPLRAASLATATGLAPTAVTGRAPTAAGSVASATTSGPASLAVAPDPCLGAGGELGVFSFYANKTITTGEGGMVTGFQEPWKNRMKIMRSHGIDRDVWQRFSGRADQWKYAVVEPGFKYNMPDIAAAIGRVQLARADELMEKRRSIVARYVTAFKDLDWMILPPHSTWATEEPLGHAWHLFTVQLKAGSDGNPRNRWVQELQNQGIGTSVHYIPLHIMPYYAKTYGLAPTDFPNAMASYEGALSLPLWADLDEASVERVIDAVLDLGRKEYGT